MRRKEITNRRQFEVTLRAYLDAKEKADEAKAEMERLRTLLQAYTETNGAADPESGNKSAGTEFGSVSISTGEKSVLRPDALDVIKRRLAGKPLLHTLIENVEVLRTDRLEEIVTEMGSNPEKYQDMGLSMRTIRSLYETIKAPRMTIRARSAKPNKHED